MKTLDTFLNGAYRNRWIKITHGEIYVRKSRRLFDVRLVPCFDIATIVIKQQGQGNFTKFLEIVEEHSKIQIDFYGIYIENIQAKRFQMFFECRGYKTVGETEFGNCYIKENWV